jgi:outer membrane lipoprotein-sorting protein
MRLAGVGAIVVCAAVVTAPAAAQTVDEIVARHVEARGGEQKLKAIETIRITRTIGTPFTRVDMVVYRKRPNLLRIEQTPVGGTTTVSGINAEAVWDPAAGGKTAIRPEPMAAQAREVDADFDGDLLVDWKAKGHTVTLDGRETVGGVETWKLTVTTKSGAVRQIFLDATTYLDYQHVGSMPLPNKREREFTITFGNWQEVEGVKFPFDADEERREGQINQSLATYTHKIELNVPMDDTLFKTPEGATPPGGK